MAEDYGLFEYKERRQCLTRMVQFVKWNPIFWLSVLFLIFSIVSLGIHSYWKFLTGIAFSIFCFLFAIVCIYLCVLSRTRKAWSQLNRRDLTKFCSLIAFCITFQSLFLTVSILLLKIHFLGEDVAWSEFPNACSPPTPTYTILNCVRTGNNIPNPYTTPGLDPILSREYIEDPQTLLSQFEGIVKRQTSCVLLYTGTDWLHFRCISEFMGLPSDLALRAFQIGNSTRTSVWAHSQSREGGWDENENDSRVRLLFSFKQLCDMQQSGFGC